MERILALASHRERILEELQAYRLSHASFVRERHPQLHFLLLRDLVNRSTGRIDQSLFLRAMALLSHRLRQLGPYQPLDPARVWIGIEASTDVFFGGFYHTDQGYRYLQQIAVLSLCGMLGRYPIDRTLITLELIRAYTHDTLHFNSYRLLAPLPPSTVNAPSFYRIQYGINFRRWDGISYSAKDSVTSRTTRNLGNIMEAATDQFAHDGFSTSG